MTSPLFGLKAGTLRKLRRGSLLVAIVVVLQPEATSAAAAKLEPEAIKAWDRYAEWADKKVEHELSDPTKFLIEDFLSPQEKSEVQKQLKEGRVVARRMKGVIPSGTRFEVPDGAIHHWWGTILVPNISLAEVLTFVKDYDNHAKRFLEVEKSRLLSRTGETYKFFFRLKRKKAVVTVYYNTEQECTYANRGRNRASSRSVATKIAELDNPGTPHEKEKPLGNDSGFLWRLVSWWRFQQTPEGVIVECESASLSRDIPWLAKRIPWLRDYLESVPQESLENILTSIRKHGKATH